jgi:hypothetical protein
MNIYLLSQEENRGYDTFDSIVVYAESPEQARLIHPMGDDRWEQSYSAWADKPEQVLVELVGKAFGTPEAGILLASFHAG